MKRYVQFIALCVGCVVACKDPAKVKALEQKQQHEADSIAAAVPQPVFESKAFDKNLLVGQWRIDVDALKRDIIKHTPSKQAADTIMQGIDVYRELRFRFNKDETFESSAQGNLYGGTWGMSGDSSSYWIRLADDFIELHEIKSLSSRRLVEYPLASMKVAQVPVTEVVFVKAD